MFLKCSTLSSRVGSGNVMKPQYMRGAVDIDGRMTGGSYLKRALALPADVNVPAVALKGKIDYSDEKASGILRATSGGGKVVADGKINLKNEHYDAEVNLAGFNVRRVLPAGDIGSVSGSVTVEGSGYDIYKMRTDAFADIASIEYAGVEYRDLSASASLDNGSYDVALSSNDEKVMLGMNLQGQMTPDEYHVKFDGRIDNIDLVAMNMATERLSGGMNIQGVGLINPKKKNMPAICACPIYLCCFRATRSAQTASTWGSVRILNTLGFVCATTICACRSRLRWG